MKNFSLKTRANSHRNSSRSRLYKTIFFVLIAIVALFLFGSLVGKAASLVSLPVYAVRNWMEHSTAILPSYIRSRNELIDEIDKLKEQLSAQGGKEASIARLTEENTELEALVSTSEPKRILAAVTARPPFLPYDALLIDQGSAEGIVEGAVVYVGSDKAIGTIAKVFTHSALVTLFSTSGVTATAYVIGPNIYTTLTGEGGGVMRLSIPRGIELQKGDVVIIPSLGMGIIGTIEEIEAAPTQPVQDAYVLSEISIQSLHLISVDPQVPPSITYEDAENIVKQAEKRFSLNIPEGVIINGGQATSTATGTPGETASTTQDSTSTLSHD